MAEIKENRKAAQKKKIGNSWTKKGVLKKEKWKINDNQLYANDDLGNAGEKGVRL